MPVESSFHRTSEITGAYESKAGATGIAMTVANKCGVGGGVLLSSDWRNFSVALLPMSQMFDSTWLVLMIPCVVTTTKCFPSGEALAREFGSRPDGSLN